MTDRCPYVTEERGADGHHTCLASRTHRRCAYKCTVTEASLCLDYQRARADAAEAKVARLTSELERTRMVARALALAGYAYHAYENAIIDARGTVHQPSRELGFEAAGQMFARFRISLSHALVQFEGTVPEKPRCPSPSPSDQTTSDTEPPSDAAAEAKLAALEEVGRADLDDTHIPEGLAVHLVGIFHAKLTQTESVLEEVREARDAAEGEVARLTTELERTQTVAQGLAALLRKGPVVYSPEVRTALAAFADLKLPETEYQELVEIADDGSLRPVGKTCDQAAAERAAKEAWRVWQRALVILTAAQQAAWAAEAAWAEADEAAKEAQ